MKFIAFFLICISTSIYSIENSKSNQNEYGGITKKDTVNESNSKEMMNRTIYYNKENKVVKIILEMSKDIIKTKQIVKQIEYYGENNTITKFEIIFSKEYIKETGVNRILEYMSDNDIVTKTEYYLDNKLIFSENNDALSCQFEIKLIKHFDNILQEGFKSSHAEFPNTDNILLEGRLFKCKTIAKYSNQIADIDENEKNLLLGFLKMVNNPDLIKIYNKKILVEENGNKFWVLMQDEVLKHLNKNQNMLLMYYYIGGYNNKIIISGIDFIAL